MIGLEEGSLPRRAPATPFLGDDERRRIGGRLRRGDAVSRDRYLFYTACTRPTERLYLVREAASDEGSPREASPFWEEVVALFPAEDVNRWTTRRPLSALTWSLEAAPTERERLRAVAGLWADDARRDDAEGLASANGWSRRLERARRAFTRHTRVTHPLVLAELRARSVFNVTELERFADCSSAWFFDRVIDPKTIDQEVDARLRGSVAHSALFRFFKGLPKELGTDHVVSERVEDAVRFMRSCLDQALAGVRVEMTELQRRELQQTLARDLERLVRAEAETELPLQPSRFEVAFGSERSVPELQRGLELGDGIVLSGKIDRIDVDPFSARGIVQDYKSGKSAPSARDIDKELRLQIPLYMLVLRDLVGIEPLGGVYRPLSGTAAPRAAPRRGEGRRAPRVREGGLSRRGGLLEAGRGGEGDGAALRRPDPGGRRRPRSQGRRVSRVVRPLDDVPGEARMNWTPNDEQRAAIDARGRVFVSAGAGTGKTAVLVERFVEAVCERGLDVESILVITYTKRAAGELRSRIRAALRRRGRADLAREPRRRLDLDDPRVLQPAAEGVSVRGRSRPAVPRAGRRAGAPSSASEAFDEALAAFCERDDEERARLLDDVRRARLAADDHRHLRDAALGRPRPRPRARREPALAERLEELREAARCLAEDGAADRAAARQRGGAARCCRSGTAAGRRLLDLRLIALAASAPPRFEEAARSRRAGGARRARDPRPRSAPGAAGRLRRGVSPRRSGASRPSTSRISSSLARDLLRDNPEIRERSSCASARSWSTSSRTRTASSAS